MYVYVCMYVCMYVLRKYDPWLEQQMDTLKHMYVCTVCTVYIT